MYNICMKYDKNSDSKNEMLKDFIKKLNISENKNNLKRSKIFYQINVETL